MVVVLSFFSIYGMLHLILHGILAFRTEQSSGNISNHRIIMVQNGAEYIEGLIRSLSWQEIHEEIIVIDLASTDETPEILRRLASEYEFLLVMTEQEYEEYLKSQKTTVLPL